MLKRLIRAASTRLAVTLALAGFLTYAAQVAADVRLVAPAPTPVVRDRNGQFITQSGHWRGDHVEYGYWITPPPERVVRATLALEDRRFWSHPGVDPVAVARALWQHVTGHGGSGASTLAMQVARMQHPRPRTLWAKAIEAGTAVALTAVYGRDAVLAQYLRLAPYGEGSHGIGHAARWFFDRPASDLTWAQAALLAAVPQAPARLALRRPGSRAVARAAHALDLLDRAGVIRPEERLALADPGVIPRPVRPPALQVALRLQRLVRSDTWPDTLLRSPLDLHVQAWVAKLATAHLRAWAGAGAQQAAVIVVRRRSREVLAAFGGTGGIDFTATERSPGSTLKPFLYALAIERGVLAPQDVLADLPQAAAGVRNADYAFLGPLLPRQALANSRNVPAANVLRRVGLQAGFAYLRTLGLHHLDGGAERFGLGMALGAMPTRLDRLVTAYGALAEDGVLDDLVWLDGMDRAPPARVMRPDTARLVGRFLSDPVARLPAFPRYGSSEFPFAVALKTGTSQGYRDAWTVAWSRDYLVGVWVGRPDGSPMLGLSGARAAATLAQSVLLRLHGVGRSDLLAGEFSAPRGWGEAELCTGTGRPGSCPERLTELIPPAPAATVPHPPPPLLQIVEPQPDTHVWRNPETPPSLDRLLFRPSAATAVRQIVWIVDGAPVTTAPADQPFSWKLSPGRHHFQLRVPFQNEFSPVVTVVVE